MRKKNFPHRLSLLVLLFSLSPFVQAEKSIEISINGLKGKLLENAKLYLQLEQEKNREDITAERLQQLYRQGANEIQAALRPYGYYHAEVSTDEKIEKSDAFFYYEVKKGPKLIIEKIDLTLTGDAKDDLVFQKRFDNFPLQKNNRLIQPKYDDFKEKLLSLANARGYFDAKFLTAKIEINLAENLSQITLHFDSGARYYFGPVSYSASPLSESFLQRYVPFKSGEPYLASQIQLLQQGLDSNSNFQRVIIRPKIESAIENQVPIHIDLDSRKAFQLQTGLGYGTDTGYRTLFAWKYRRVNNNGHSIENQNQISEFRDSYNLSYLVPGKNPIAEHYTWQYNHINDRPPKRNNNSRTRKFGVNYSRHLPDSPWSNTVGFQYQGENFRQVDDNESASLFMPHYQVQWRRTDNELITNHGVRFNLDTRGSSAALGSTTSFAQADIHAKWVDSFLSNYRLLLRGRVGATLDGELEEIPLSLRFYAGGDNSVRGFAYQALGPKKINNKKKSVITGGRYVLESSIEIERKITEKWRIATFYDMGNAMNSFRDSLARGAGLGLRWESPIGLIKLDFATALSEESKPLRLHFNIGPDI